MTFKENHFFHFLIVLLFIICVSTALFYKQLSIEKQARDTNRLASARLVLIALENYEKNFHKYPEKIEEIVDFISPIPVDPTTKKAFSYQKTERGYVLSIPQELGKSLQFKK